MPGGPSTRIAELDARYYAGFVDEHERFDRAVRRYLRPGDRVIDAGAGSGSAFAHDYRLVAGRVVGIDLDAAVLTNPLLDEARVADLARLPFPEESFDLVLAKYVLEHLWEPAEVLLELRRVLRRGGHLAFHTPNRRHYVALAARATPHRFHEWYNRRRGVRAHRSHRTFYRANDRSSLRRLAARTGFRIVELELFEPKPAYLFFHPLAYRLGVAYERVVRRIDRLQGLRANIIGVLEAT
jgi:SAM-dependent methyltransferase